jgi:2-oxoglutarate ferredoxin oxidoreductase subunit gamma
MLERIVIAGAGGQGIIVIGRLLAGVALRHYQYLTFFPSYGAEVRGGASQCQVILSSDEIASPVSTRFEAALVMNQTTADKFLPSLEPNGVAVVNTSLCKVPRDPRFIEINATDLAVEMGNIRIANSIMLGGYVAASKVVPAADVESAMREAVGAQNPLAELNVRAFRAGMQQ